MNILLYDYGSYTQKDLIYYLKQAGHCCKNILYYMKDKSQDAFFERHFRAYLTESSWDCVISTNFYPIVAKLCYEHNIKYLAWIYDCPINANPISDFQYPTSYIFLFDRIEATRISQLGGINIFHLPLAASPLHIRKLKISENDKIQFSADVSFVGQFYDNILNQLMYDQSDYDQGYINALLLAQLKVYGYNFLEEMLSEELIERMNIQFSKKGRQVDGLTVKNLARILATQVTQTERLTLCSMMGKFFQTKYYSNTQPPSLTHLYYGGTASYHTDMRKIFYLSKLNLNPTLRSIQSGIPLRALDILSCQGVLLSNYQPELAEYFIDGKDVILYESIEDAICKADYYLRHEDERQKLAQNGYQKICAHFSYPDRIQTMFKTAELL